MGIHKCYLCGCNPGPFFIWTTTRYFNVEKLMTLKRNTSKNFRNQIKYNGESICFDCVKHYELMDR